MGIHWAENTIEIAATPDEVFEAITDYESFPEWISAVFEADVTDRDSDGLGEVVKFVADGKVRKIKYTLRYHYDRPSRIWWDFLDGEGIKQMDGEWTFEENDGGTNATYKVGVDAGRGIPGPVVSRSNKQTIAAVNKELKAETERRTSQTAGSGASSRFEGKGDEETAWSEPGEAPPPPRRTAAPSDPESDSPIPFGMLPEPLGELAKLPGKVLVRIGRLLGG
jgi:coenzyme Q-binding protein COQ10